MQHKVTGHQKGDLGVKLLTVGCAVAAATINNKSKNVHKDLIMILVLRTGINSHPDQGSIRLVSIKRLWLWLLSCPVLNNRILD